VWDKGSIGLGHADYRPQHEFCFYMKGTWTGDKAQSDVWTLGRDASTSYAHPTQKPVALLERAVANSCKRDGLVLDVFGGSGSTLIAADRLGRRARLVELDPRYCDVIRKRYEDQSR
jgi:DNA modification methylase